MKPAKNFNLEQWLQHLENLPYEAILLGLTRVKSVAATLDLLKPKAAVISVAGTNGKGSTVAALEAIYCTQGYQVASYTSPHLFSFNERIKINQKNIRDEDLTAAFFVIEEARQNTHLTYFEMTTLAALWHFKNHPIDIMILEVGLGGRLDATNIIDSDLAIITTIDFDHQHFLGHTLEAIGAEKAGILRENKPFIYADVNAPQSVLAKAKTLNCLSCLYGIHYSFTQNEETFTLRQQHGFHLQLPCPKLSLAAAAAAVMAALQLKNKLPIKVEQLAKALDGLFLPGRLQLLPGKPTTLFDVSHNPQAVKRLVDFIKNLSWKGAIQLVFSALSDKDLLQMIAPMMALSKQWYPAFLSGKRAASRAQFAEIFHVYGIVPKYYANPLAAFKAACVNASLDDLIVVYGSFLTVGEVLSQCYLPRAKEKQ